MFGQLKLEYLGHIIYSAGVQADPPRLRVISWPILRDIKSLREFWDSLDITENLSKIMVRLLPDLLKADPFSWEECAQQAFEALKLVMTQTPILAMPNFSQPFVIEADASGFGVGVVLMQNGKPISYFSRMLSSKARQCSIYEQELMAIVLAVKRWNHYLLGHHFIIKTDQKALEFFLGKRVMDENQQKWVSKLMGYKFEIKYKPGVEWLMLCQDTGNVQSYTDFQFGNIKTRRMGLGSTMRHQNGFYFAKVNFRTTSR